MRHWISDVGLEEWSRGPRSKGKVVFQTRFNRIVHPHEQNIQLLSAVSQPVFVVSNRYFHMLIPDISILHLYDYFFIACLVHLDLP